ncbi:hypothetical protein EC973_005012 [Apophysomyces ossiformis]|uniref:Uncharacterized protein n=1 Tax=Apophysomyces ossiformis TaxID=679940 RepID=A0A8H7EPL0_9FUNG|nr:hypothetical protein EC973_005012 [Apophysomyces ossiformis]
MSSKVIKEESTHTPVTTAVSAKEIEEEAENQRKDQELKELLATSKLLEEYHMDEMSSRDRRKHMMSKLENLGVKPSPSIKVPLAMHLGLEAKKKERQQKRLQKAKDLGLYDKSTRHLYVEAKTKKRDRDPGITNGIGKMRGAMLTISKREIAQVNRQGSKKSGRKKK